MCERFTCTRPNAVAVGYLNDPRKTKQAFINSPDWLKAMSHPSTSELMRWRPYKTDNLVKYKP